MAVIKAVSSRAGIKTILNYVMKEEKTEQSKKENKVKIDENQNEKDEIIQKINDVLSVLEYERLEEVLKYVKRKKNQKK